MANFFTAAVPVADMVIEFLSRCVHCTKVKLLVRKQNASIRREMYYFVSREVPTGLTS